MHSKAYSLLHSQAAQPYSNKHVIQNFWRTPSHLEIAPPYCTKQLSEGGQRAAAQYGCGLATAETGAGRRPAERNKRRSGLPYLGSSLSATPLCIWNSLVLSLFSFVCLFFPPKKRIRFFKSGSLIFGCVLGYWHALCTGWTPDWASRRWGQGRRTVSPLSQHPRHHTSAF